MLRLILCKIDLIFLYLPFKAISNSPFRLSIPAALLRFSSFIANLAYLIAIFFYQVLWNLDSHFSLPGFRALYSCYQIYKAPCTRILFRLLFLIFYYYFSILSSEDHYITIMNFENLFYKQLLIDKHKLSGHFSFAGFLPFNFSNCCIFIFIFALFGFTIFISLSSIYKFY